MSKRKRRCAASYDYATGCPACAKPMVLTFDKPKPGEATVITKDCIHEEGCASNFQFIIKKKVLVDANGEEFPLSITRKVLTLTEKGRGAFEARKAPKVPPKNPYDKMS